MKINISRKYFNILKRIVYVFLIPIIISGILFYPYKKIELKGVSGNSLLLNSLQPLDIRLDSAFIKSNLGTTLIQKLFNTDFLFNKYDLIAEDDSWISDTKIAKYFVNMTLDNKSKILEYKKDIIFYYLDKTKDYELNYYPQIKVIYDKNATSTEFGLKFNTKFLIRNSLFEYILKTILFVLAYDALFLLILGIFNYIKKGKS